MNIPASGAAPFYKAGAACEKQVKQMLQEASAKILLAASPPPLPEDEDDDPPANLEPTDPLDVVIRRTFESIERGARESISDFSAEAAKLNKETLHAQQFEFGSKIERTRRSSVMTMQQQAVALEAAKTAALLQQQQELVSKFTSGDDGKDTMLRELNEQVADLTRKLGAQTSRAQRVEEELAEASAANQAAAAQGSLARSG